MINHSLQSHVWTWLHVFEITRSQEQSATHHLHLKHGHTTKSAKLSLLLKVSTHHNTQLNEPDKSTLFPPEQPTTIHTSQPLSHILFNNALLCSHSCLPWGQSSVIQSFLTLSIQTLLVSPYPISSTSDLYTLFANPSSFIRSLCPKHLYTHLSISRTDQHALLLFSKFFHSWSYVFTVTSHELL